MAGMQDCYRYCTEINLTAVTVHFVFVLCCLKSLYAVASSPKVAGVQERTGLEECILLQNTQFRDSVML